MFAPSPRAMLRGAVIAGVALTANLLAPAAFADPTDTPPPTSDTPPPSETPHDDHPAHPDDHDRRDDHIGRSVGVGVSVDPSFILNKAFDLFGSESKPPVAAPAAPPPTAPAAAGEELPRRALLASQVPTGPRPESGVPPVGETRLAEGEIVVEVAPTLAEQTLVQLEQRHRLARAGGFFSQLSGTQYLRYRFSDGRSVAAAVREVESDATVLSAQPNYLFALQDGAKPGEQPLQYAAIRLELPEAHRLTKGEHVLVGMIDSKVDNSSPELAGSIVGSFDAVGDDAMPATHGTAIAALIAGHAMLEGSAPAARLLCAHAFDDERGTARGTTFDILKALDWLAVHASQVVNMSFAGPSDPAFHRGIEAAYKNGIVLVAAAGNAGAQSPPLFPAVDADVIAVAATDEKNGLYPADNRGRYIALAAPGVDVLVAAPDGRYDIASGTSFSAAEVSGVAALVLAQMPASSPDAVRSALVTSASALFRKPPRDGFAPRLVDARRAVSPEKLAAAPTKPATRKKPHR